MKKKVLLVITFSLSSILLSQENIEKFLVGKWKLVSVEKNGLKKDIYDMYGTDNVYHIFRKDKTYMFVIRDNNIESKWDIDGNKVIIFNQESERNDTSFHYHLISIDDERRTEYHEDTGYSEYVKF